MEQGVAEKVFETNYPREITEFLLVGLQFLLDPGIFQWNEAEIKQRQHAAEEILHKLLGIKVISL